MGTEESELLVATFSGRIFALRSSHLVTGAKVPPDILAARRGKLEYLLDFFFTFPYSR